MSVNLDGTNALNAHRFVTCYSADIPAVPNRNIEAPTSVITLGVDLPSYYSAWTQ